MFYSKKCIENDFNFLLKKLEEQELFLSEPMQDYKLGKNWTDEIRISHGHTKLADGSWVTIHKVSTWAEKLKKDTSELYEQNTRQCREIEFFKRQIYEMEYGLRVAEKALKTSLALTEEMINE